MIEIEVKILNIDKDDIIKKLESIGAKKVLDSFVNIYYLDTVPRTLRPNGKMLRVREIGGSVELTFKEKMQNDGNAKVQRETEVNTTNFEDTLKIFELLGYKKYKNIKKHRISYEFEGVRFEIDKINNIPHFLEIEGPNVNIINKYVLLLGFSVSDAKPLSQDQILSIYEMI